MYRVANASQYLAITGKGIADIKIAKKSWVFPWQSCTVLDLSPVSYTFNIQAMSAEKLPFILPAVFTIGPNADEPECLLKYARLLSAHDQHSNHDLIQGVIEGETRVLAASMTMEAIFQGTKEFKKQVLDDAQLELNKFGLLIYNANLKQLLDQRKEEGQKEDIKVQAEVKLFENQRETELAEANSELAIKKVSWLKAAQLAEVEAAKAVTLREAELQKGVEDMEKPKVELQDGVDQTKVSLFIHNDLPYFNP